MSQDYPTGQQPVNNRTNQSEELDSRVDQGIAIAKTLEDVTDIEGDETFSGMEDIVMPQDMDDNDYTPEGSMEDPAYEVITDFFSIASDHMDELFSRQMDPEPGNYEHIAKGIAYENGELTEETESFRNHFVYDDDENVRGLAKTWNDRNQISRERTSDILAELSDVESLKAFDDLVSGESIEQVESYLDTDLLEDSYLVESGEPTDRAEELMETTREFYHDVMEITADRVEQYRIAAEGSLDIQKQYIAGNFTALKSQGFNPQTKNFNS